MIKLMQSNMYMHDVTKLVYADLGLFVMQEVRRCTGQKEPFPKRK